MGKCYGTEKGDRGWAIGNRGKKKSKDLRRTQSLEKLKVAAGVQPL
jgi:hypothetical protein